MPKRAGEKRIPGGKWQQTLEVLNDASHLARSFLYIIFVVLSITWTANSGREARVVRVTSRPQEDAAVEGYQKLPTSDRQEPRTEVDQHVVRALSERRGGEGHGELPQEKCNAGLDRLDGQYGGWLAFRPTRKREVAVAVRLLKIEWEDDEEKIFFFNNILLW